MMQVRGKLRVKAARDESYNTFASDASKRCGLVQSFVSDGEDVLAEAELCSAEESGPFAVKLSKMIDQGQAHLQGIKDAKKRLEPISLS